MPEEWKLLSGAMPDPGSVYARLPSVPVDVAIMEKASNGYVLPAPDLKWTDLGSWDALFQMVSEKNATANHHVSLSGCRLSSVDSTGCLVKAGPNRHIALVGVEDLIVVEDGENLLIARRSKDQLVKKLSESRSLPLRDTILSWFGLGDPPEESTVTHQERGRCHFASRRRVVVFRNGPRVWERSERPGEWFLCQRKTACQGQRHAAGRLDTLGSVPLE